MQDGLDQETVYLIDVVTTNKTDFFREAKHFDYLQSDGVAGDRPIAACGPSAPGVRPARRARNPTRWRWCWRNSPKAATTSPTAYLATDLSTDVLQTARRGIYPEDLIAPVPRDLQRKYVLTAKQPGRREVRITPKLRSKIGFARMNLMDEKYPIGEPMHVIFCRNVLIYFDKQTQAGVLNRLCACLARAAICSSAIPNRSPASICR